MEKKILLIILGLFVAIFSYSQESKKNDSIKKVNWLIEPIKITSLMVNSHPEYNAWGFEAGRRITDKLWITSMIEKTKGGDFESNFDPNYDFLVTFDYFAWLNTFRYYLKPEEKFSLFFDAGIELQTASHKFFRNNELFEENAVAIGPLLLAGYEVKMGKFMHFKMRMGGFINIYRSGSMKHRIDDGQDQPSFYLYPHLSDAVIGKGTYAGDVAIGFKF